MCSMGLNTCNDGLIAQDRRGRLRVHKPLAVVALRAFGRIGLRQFGSSYAVSAGLTELIDH